MSPVGKVTFPSVTEEVMFAVEFTTVVFVT